MESYKTLLPFEDLRQGNTSSPAPSDESQGLPGKKHSIFFHADITKVAVYFLSKESDSMKDFYVQNTDRYLMKEISQMIVPGEWISGLPRSIHFQAYSYKQTSL